MVRTKGGKKIPVGSNQPKNSGEIVFYDVGQRKKVSIPRSKVRSEKTSNGKYKLTATAPNRSKAGNEYSLHRFSTTPA